MSLDGCTRVIRTFSDEVDEKDFSAVESDKPDSVGSYLTSLNIISSFFTFVFPDSVGSYLASLNTDIIVDKNKK